MSTSAVVLAAGAGSRLGELGRRHSKAMVPVAGRPLLGWVIERLCAAGVDRLLVVRHSEDGGLRAWLEDAHPGALLVDQAERSGIADALALALPSLPAGEPFLACACDSLFEARDIAALIALGRAEPGAAVVGVLEMGVEATASRSAVRVERGRVVEIVEKPPPGSVDTPLVAMPLYWLPAAIGTHLASARHGRESYVSVALAAFLRARGRVLALQVESRVEITTAEDIARAEERLRA